MLRSADLELFGFGGLGCVGSASPEASFPSGLEVHDMKLLVGSYKHIPDRAVELFYRRA